MLPSRALEESKCELLIFRRFRHRGDTGNITMLKSLCLWARLASVIVRLETTWLFAWRTSLAMVVEEMTTVVTWPSFKCINGP
ncbi:hypothetical protein TIFTF001_018353 [Ficus carica]|uniref:Uncharacterized protein n=1 Tax=Ficus carica TaxID=3494 RepID=A0AA88D7W6_FICCA|nr:hypothetical protein TIFTF001_018353 [Ficus carica]